MKMIGYIYANICITQISLNCTMVPHSTTNDTSTPQVLCPSKKHSIRDEVLMLINTAAYQNKQFFIIKAVGVYIVGCACVHGYIYIYM